MGLEMQYFEKENYCSSLKIQKCLSYEQEVSIPANFMSKSKFVFMIFMTILGYLMD